MKGLISFLAIVSINIFFVISTIIGYEYRGIEESNIYVLYVLIVASLNIFVIIKFFLTKKISISYKELVVLSIPLIVIIIYLITILNGKHSLLGKTYFQYFLIWSTPAIYSAFYIYKNKLFENIVKYMEIMMLLITFSIIKSAFIPFVMGSRFESLGGATYQTASYLSSFAFGLNLYFILFGNLHKRFKFTKFKTYTWISFVFLIVQFLGIFLSGGRGGIVLLFVYSVYILFAAATNRQKRLTKRTILVFGGIVLTLTLIMPMLLQNNNFIGGFNRTLQFISIDSGINWEGTSNRDIVYLNAINLIQQKPFLGYGLFGFWSVSGYPHNIFLEVLLNGGFVSLIIFLIFMFSIIRKLKNMIECKPQYRLLFIILLYPLISLLFTGTYIMNTEFWFIITYILIYKRDRSSFSQSFIAAS